MDSTDIICRSSRRNAMGAGRARHKRSISVGHLCRGYEVASAAASISYAPASMFRSSGSQESAWRSALRGVRLRIPGARADTADLSRSLPIGDGVFHMSLLSASGLALAVVMAARALARFICTTFEGPVKYRPEEHYM